MSQPIHEEHDLLQESISELSLQENEVTGEIASENYFGENARQNFFHHYKRIMNQSKITLDELDEPEGDGEEEMRSVHSQTEKTLPRLRNNFMPLAPLNGKPLSPLKENAMKPPRKDNGGTLSPLPSARGRERSNSHSRTNSRNGNNSSRNPSRSITPEHSFRSSPLPEIRSPAKPEVGGMVQRGSRPSSRNSLNSADSDNEDTQSVSSEISQSSYTSRGSQHGKRNLPLRLSPLIPRDQQQRQQEQADDDDTDEQERRSVAEQDQDHDDEDLDSLLQFSNAQKRSPRTKYIRKCIKENMNPRPSLLLRKNISKSLELQHHGMNDDFAKSFAASLGELPYLESINIADNRLSDVGLTAIILEITHLKTLTELNLSQNKIGKNAANALYQYLSSSNCSLNRLILHAADIDDDECSRLIRSIQTNLQTKIVDLDLSQNEIGKKENFKKHHHLNSPNPKNNNTNGSSHSMPLAAVEGFGADAIANLLLSGNCQLIRLNLTWNMIRLDGAMNLAKSLGVNNTLVHLDLSYNSLGTAGSIAIGSALLKNRSLEYLNLSFNSIDAIGCLTLCAGIIENCNLQKINLDGNPIGDQGIKAILLLPIISIRGIEITVENCNVSIKDPNCFFDFDRIDQDYVLNMENGFHRAVAILLIHFIAGHQKFNFSNFSYADNAKPTGKGLPAEGVKPHLSLNANANLINVRDAAPLIAALKFQPIELTPIVSKDCVLYFSEKEKKLFSNLKQLQTASSNLHNAAELFQEMDIDHCGSIGKREISLLMKKLGIEMTDKRLHDLLKRYDVNDNETLDFLAFLTMIKHLRQEADVRIKEMTERPVLVARNSANNTLNESEAEEPYLPPETGYLSISVINDLTRTGISRVLTTCDCDHILAIVKAIGGGNFLQIVMSCLNHSLLRMNEALVLIDLLVEEVSDKVDIVQRVLMQLYDSADAIHFIHSVFQHNHSEVMRLKWEYGMILRPLLGHPNGYYVLDLSKEMDRKCLLRLVKIDHAEKVQRINEAIARMGGEESCHHHVGDLSQHGNYSCFRNETLNNEPITMNDVFAAALPNSGIFQFDFISIHRPTTSELLYGSKTDHQIVHLLVQYCLLRESDVEIAEQKLDYYRNLAQEGVSCSGRGTVESSPVRAEAIGQHMYDFYQNLSIRTTQFQESRAHLCKPAGNRSSILAETVVKLTKSSQSRTRPKTVAELHTSAPSRELFSRDSYPMLTTLISPFPSTVKAPSRAISKEEAFSARPVSHNSTTSNGIHKEIDFSIDTNDSFDEFCVSASRDEMDRMEVIAVTSKQNTESKSSVIDDQAKPSTLDSDLVQLQSDNSNVHSDNGKASSLLHIQTNASMHALKQGHLHHHQEDEDFHSPSSKNEELNDGDTPMNSLEAELIRKAKQMREAQHRDKKHLHHHQRSNSNSKDDFLAKFRSLLDSSHVQGATKAHRLVDVLEDVFAKSWILARHVALIIECFVQFGYFKQTQFFGTYRVELVVTLFARIIDLHNFDLVLSVLSPFEAACVICRLGFLRVFNPCKPEGSWELDLSRREERLIVKMICMLGIYEPGNNFLHCKFRWSREMESLPGWELGNGWLSDEGMPTKGILTVTYYSGEGKGYHDCKPFVSFRKALLNLVLVKEEEIVLEEGATFPSPSSPLATAGSRCFEKHKELWETFFVPLPLDQNGKKLKKKNKDNAKN